MNNHSIPARQRKYEMRLCEDIFLKFYEEKIQKYVEKIYQIIYTLYIKNIFLTNFNDNMYKFTKNQGVEMNNSSASKGFEDASMEKGDKCH